MSSRNNKCHFPKLWWTILSSPTNLLLCSKSYANFSQVLCPYSESSVTLFRVQCSRYALTSPCCLYHSLRNCSLPFLLLGRTNALIFQIKNSMIIHVSVTGKLQPIAIYFVSSLIKYISQHF